MSNNELSGHGELLRCEAESFFCHFEGNAFDFKDDATRSDGEHKTYRVTLTFTHADVGRLLSDRFVGENANPALSFTLHVTRHSDTCSFDLTTGNPVRIEALDAEATKSELVTALGVAFAAALMRAAVLSSFRL